MRKQGVSPRHNAVVHQNKSKVPQKAGVKRRLHQHGTNATKSRAVLVLYLTCLLIIAALCLYQGRLLKNINQYNGNAYSTSDNNNKNNNNNDIWDENTRRIKSQLFQTNNEPQLNDTNFKNAQRHQRGLDKSVAACLIIKDDNHWLIEWLAYHYHVMPLRHLIVVQDPTSQTSALPVLERWMQNISNNNNNNNTPFINITIWDDEYFVPEWLKRRMPYETPLWLHLNRQAAFYSYCMKHLWGQGHRSWVLLTDTDEFVQVNERLHPQDLDRKEPGHVTKYLGSKKVNDLCMYIPRIQMSSEESGIESSSSSSTGQVQSAFNTSQFMTYRWLVHTELAMTSGKNMINMKQFKDRSQIPRQVFSVHQVLKDKCPAALEPGDPLVHEKALLVIQHYLGTLEQYMFRDDPRNSNYTVKFDQPAFNKREEQYFTRGRGKPRHKETNMDWLPGFIDSVGIDHAKRLLQDVGIVDAAKKAPTGSTFNTLPRNITQKATESTGMAACLLVKDDNHWLSEWLAYHYHVLPLRRLVVVRDPTSLTSPQHLWDRWKDRIEIEEWQDSRFIPSWITAKHKDGTYTDVNLHRYRQQFFFAKCLSHLKASGASWTIFVDSDEFVRPNPYLSKNKRSLVDLSKPGVTLGWLNKMTSISIKKNGKKGVTCLHIPRLQMTSTESPADIVQDKSLPDFVNASQFLTTRWRFHNGHDINFGHNLDGKNVINAQWVERKWIPNRAVSAHQIVENICPVTDGERLEHPESLLLIHHYLGTYEQFTYRNDPRNSIQGRPKRDVNLWNSTGQSPPATIRDDSMSEWLVGFINNVGEDEASKLLDGVGVLE